MAFINEDLTKEQAQKLQAEYRLTGYDRKSPLSMTHWVVDKERDAFLVERGGGFLERPFEVILVWGDYRVSIEYQRRWQVKGEREVSLYMRQIVAPEVLREKAEELIELIMDAFACLHSGSKSNGKIQPSPYVAFFEHINPPIFIKGYTADDRYVTTVFDD